MPIFKIEEKLPECGELDEIRLVKTSGKKEETIKLSSPKSALFFIEGTGICLYGSEGKLYSKGDIILTEADTIKLKPMGSTSLLYIGGSWKSQFGNYGFFTLKSSESPQNKGDEAPYERNTLFDNHYHDCDEYWIFLKGKGKAVSEGTVYNFEAGDCIITKTGFHHDIPKVTEDVEGVYFETSLNGKRRRGHLWEHTHGAPEIMRESAV